MIIKMHYLSQQCRKSAVHVVDAKTMSSEPVAVIDLPQRVPPGFHALFVTEVSFFTTQVSELV